MKKIMWKKIVYFIGLLFLIVACKNPLQQSGNKIDEKIVAEKVTIKIATDFTNITGRAVSVSLEDEIEYYESLIFTLKATDSESNESVLLEEITYNELLEATPEIEPKTWTFTLFADDTEKESTVLAAVCEKAISAEDSFVEFQMTTVEGVTGSVKIKILYGSNYVSSNEGKIVYPDFTFKVIKTKLNESNLVNASEPEFECVLAGVEEANGLYSNTYVAEYAVGKWFIQALYNGQIEASDIFYVSPNLTTVAELFAGKPVTFKNKSEYTVNYGIDLLLNTIQGNSGKSLEAGDKLVVKISGTPNATAVLKLDSLIYEVSATDWNLMSVASNEIELKENEYFTSKYYYIINNSTGLDNGIQFYYNKSDLPAELTIDNFNIEIGTEEEFDKPVYTYYIDNRLAARIMGEKDETYTLPVSTGLDDHKLVAWYDNPNFEGDPITEITAEENTADRTFYAKYNLAFTDSGDPGWRSASILLDVMNMSAPEPGQIITVKYSGKSNVTNNKCEFNTELGYTDDSNVWHRFENANCWTYYVLKENEDVELRFDIKVPEDFDPTTKNLAISMGARSNEEIILSDWNVSVEYCDIETAFVNNGISAVSDQDGIHFTIENTDVTDWIRISVEDLETGISYNLNDTLAPGKVISFDYPYVNENQIYNFQMAYVKVFEGEKNETWLNKEVWVKAAGGSGEIDQTAYNNISISLSDDDSDRMYRYLKFDGFDEVALLEMIPNIDEANLKFTIWAGEGWNWVYGTDIFFDENPIFNKIATEGKIDVVELAEQMDNLSKLNEEGKYWADFGLVLTQDDYGKIELPGKKTDKTTYVPLGKICTVNFYDNGELYYQTKIMAGESVGNLFEYDVTYENQIFVGWVYDSIDNEPFSFDDVIENDVNVYTVWNFVKHTVTFKDGEKITKQQVEYNTFAKEPTLPVKENYTFLGWFTEEGFEFNFNQPITSDITLEAKWQAPSAGISVNFVTIGNNEENTLKVEYEVVDDVIELTATSSNENVKFFGWMKDNSQEIFIGESFTTSITNSEGTTITCFGLDENGSMLETLLIKLSR